MHDDIRVATPVRPTHNELTPKEATAATFKTPDEVAAHDFIAPLDLKPDQAAVEPKTASRSKFRLHRPTKKQTIIGSSILTAMILLSMALFLSTRHNRPVSYAVIKPKIAPKTIVAKPTTVPSSLTGLAVAPAVNGRPVTAVMIENTPQARPQSGLSQAGVVFEAIAEGGITRFMALYQDQEPSMIGPVRSARPYYLDWDLGFDAPYAHIGGSQAALADIPAWGVKNLDGLIDPGPYHRIASRQAPHNDYSSIPSLIALEASKGWTSSSFTGFPRKPDQPAKNPSVSQINFNPSYFSYASEFAYDNASNSYNRSEGGAAQTDANNNQQLSPKVVIGMIVPFSRGPLDTSGAYYSDYQVIGSGQAYVFQDGGLTIGQWSKTSPTSQIVFSTASGLPLKLNAGQTWITALASNSQINYK